jgi:hypothetical protein
MAITDALDRALARARRRGRGQRARSPLFLAMIERAAQVTEARKDVTWRGLAEELAAEGITGPGGRVYSGAAVKGAFYRARQALAAAGGTVVFGAAPKIRRKPSRKGRVRARSAPALPQADQPAAIEEKPRVRDWRDLMQE